MKVDLAAFEDQAAREPRFVDATAEAGMSAWAAVGPALDRQVGVRVRASLEPVLKRVVGDRLQTTVGPILARQEAVEDDAEVVAEWVSKLAPAIRRRLTVSEVRCARCVTGGLLMRVVALPAHLERRHFGFLAIQTRRAHSTHREQRRARWLNVRQETWQLECQKHRGRWEVDLSHLTGRSQLPGLNVVLVCA